ncbi:MAG: phosphate-starvation-inducible PsiE family protein [Cyanobacteriota bacterium]|nr:phosphate-starvation-inducible PsiE family protein [Cyanobacteriota bacterium]
MEFLNDKKFLDGIHGYERQLAKLLAVLLAVVLGVATFYLIVETGANVFRFQINWFDGGLIKLLDRLLLIFIALEVLQNITAYLRDQVVQIELVLLTALTAVARKVIVLPPGTDYKPQLMLGFGVIAVGLSIAYWLVRNARSQLNDDQANL